MPQPRELPRDLDHERYLLAGCIVDPAAIDRLTLEPRHFFDTSHGEVWNLLQDMRSCGDPVGDVPAIAARMKARGIWQQANGMAWLGKIFQDGMVHRFHVDHYAKELVRLSNLRRLIDIGEILTDGAFQLGANPEQLAATASAAIAARMEVADDVFRLDHLLDGLIAELDAPPKAQRRVFTGWGAFDETFGPLMSGELTIVGASTSIGKTAFMLQICLYHASKGRPVLFASLEMSTESVRNRIACAMAGIDAARFRAGDLTADEKDQIRAARRELDGWPFYVWNPRGQKTIPRIAAKARSVKAEHGIQLLAVDYLQKIHGDSKRIDRQEEVASVARGLKDISIDLDLPVITGSQLNREADHDGEPTLRHLRESGAIEQEADVVILIHRKHRLDTTGKLIVAKFRNGSPGSLKLKWNALLQQFSFECDDVRDMANYEKGFDAWNEP